MIVHRRILAALLAGTIALAACSSESGSTLPQPEGGEGARNTGGALTVAVAFPPRSGLAVASDDAFILVKAGAVETLVRAGVDGSAEPLLAGSWEQTDPLTWQFQLRDDVRFHDGSPLDADAVVGALDHVLSSAAPPRALADTGMEVAAVDDVTVEVTTDQPDPIVPLRLSSPSTAILAPAAYEATPPAIEETGTGPFAITGQSPGQSLELQRFEDYWGEGAALDGVTVRFLPEAASRVDGVRSGEIDIAEGVPAADVPLLENDPDIVLAAAELPRTTTLYTNVEEGPLADVRVRRALSLAIDREALAELVLQGAAAPAAGYFGDTTRFGSSEDAPAVDAAQARSLLDEAGYADGELTVELWTYPARAELPDVAAAIKDMLAEVGVEVRLTVAEYQALEPRVLAGEHDLFLLSRSYITDMPDAGAFLRSDVGCEGDYNLNRSCEPEIEELLDRLGKPDADRQAIFRVAGTILTDEVIGIPLVHDRARIVHRPHVVGLEIDPLEQRLVTSALARER